MVAPTDRLPHQRESLRDRQSTKNAADVTFHWIDEKHFGQLIDEVRQFEESLSVSGEMRFDQFSLKISNKQRPFQSVQLVRLDVSCSRENDLRR